MFSEEKCPSCNSGDYEVQDYEEDYQDDYFSRDWYCKCGNCKSLFTITYLYKLTSVEVSAS